MLILYHGRPENIDGRLSKEIRTYDFLEKLGVEYDRVDHEAAQTMEACAEIDSVLQAAMCKNLFLCNRQCTEFYLLLISGDKHFKTKDVSAQLGVARLSFADESYMEKYLDIAPGSVTVMGLMNDKENHVQLLIDRDLINTEYIGFHPCINTSSIKIKTAELIDKVIPALAHKPIFVDLPVYETKV